MGTNRNRSAGHDFELYIIKRLKELGLHPHAVSCRSTNRMRDGQGIDIVNSDESEQGRMIDDIQCKCTTLNPDYSKLLDALKHDTRYPVVFHRKTKKASTRFMVKGEYATVHLDKYLKLMAYRAAFKALLSCIDSFDPLIFDEESFEGGGDTLKIHLTKLGVL